MSPIKELRFFAFPDEPPLYSGPDGQLYRRNRYKINRRFNIVQPPSLDPELRKKLTDDYFR